MYKIYKMSKMDKLTKTKKVISFNTIFLFLIALFLLGILFLEYGNGQKVSYLECRGTFAPKFFTYKDDFSKLYSVAIDYSVEKIEIEYLIRALSKFIKNSSDLEYFFGAEICSKEILKVIKKSRGTIYRFREMLSGNPAQLSINKMIDEFQFINSKLDVINIDQQCCPLQRLLF